jgi:tripartite-type tricarboxylate transporter receptor subunit TctC
MMTKLLLAFLLSFSAAGAQAQEYPNRPIRLVVPASPGGGADFFARIVATRMSELLGQNMWVDFKPGGNGIIGTDAVAKAAPDGYTLLAGNNGPLSILPVLAKSLPYNPVEDFVPLSQLTVIPYVLTSDSKLSMRSYGELVAYAKANPGKLAYGSYGIGSPNHLAGELFAQMAGVELLHVPYKGTADAFRDLLGGQIPIMFVPTNIVAPHVKEGRVRAMAVSRTKRSAVLPEVPTLDELGLRGFEVTTWQGVLAPKGTPKAIVDKLYAALAQTAVSKEVVQQFATAGYELGGTTPAEFLQLIRSDAAKYGKLVKDANIQAQ